MLLLMQLTYFIFLRGLILTRNLRNRGQLTLTLLMNLI